MWSPADWKAFKAKYQWLLKWDCGHCFGPISIQLLYPQWCRWPSKKKEKKGGGVITNAHRRPFNNAVGRRGAWRSRHCLFLKLTQLCFIKKYSYDMFYFGAMWLTFCINLCLFMRCLGNSLTLCLCVAVYMKQHSNSHQRDSFMLSEIALIRLMACWIIVIIVKCYLTCQQRRQIYSDASCSVRVHWGTLCLHVPPDNANMLEVCLHCHEVHVNTVAGNCPEKNFCLK